MKGNGKVFWILNDNKKNHPATRNKPSAKKKRRKSWGGHKRPLTPYSTSPLTPFFEKPRCIPSRGKEKIVKISDHDEHHLHHPDSPTTMAANLDQFADLELSKEDREQIFDPPLDAPKTQNGARWIFLLWKLDFVYAWKDFLISIISLIFCCTKFGKCVHNIFWVIKEEMLLSNFYSSCYSRLDNWMHFF